MDLDNTVNRIIDELARRSGFSNVWDDCDLIIKGEIRQAIRKIVDEECAEGAAVVNAAERDMAAQAAQEVREIDEAAEADRTVLRENARQALPHDVQRLLQTIQGAQEVEERLKAHKAEQAKLMEPKLQEIKGWLTKLANELSEMLKAHPSAFPGFFYASVIGEGDQLVLDFCGSRIVFEPFYERAMIQCRPDNQSFGGQYTQTDQVTEDWVRNSVIQMITRIMKADHLQGPG